MFNAEPNRYIDLKKMMYRQEQYVYFTNEFLMVIQLDRKCNSPQVSAQSITTQLWQKHERSID